MKKALLLMLVLLFAVPLVCLSQSGHRSLKSHYNQIPNYNKPHRPNQYDDRFDGHQSPFQKKRRYARTVKQYRRNNDDYRPNDSYDYDYDRSYQNRRNYDGYRYNTVGPIIRPRAVLRVELGQNDRWYNRCY